MALASVLGACFLCLFSSEIWKLLSWALGSFLQRQVLGGHAPGLPGDGQAELTA